LAVLDNLQVDLNQILFIPKNNSNILPMLNQHFKDRPTLTISEKRKLRTGCINFVENDMVLQFEINPALIKKRGMKVSQSLIKLGVEVK